MGRPPEAERGARRSADSFVARVNQAESEALILQRRAHDQDPARFDDPLRGPLELDARWHPAARDMYTASILVRGLLEAVDRGDADEGRQLVTLAQDRLRKMTLRPEISWEGENIVASFEVISEDEDFFASLLLLQFIDFVRYYSQYVTIAICRECGKAFVRAKRGDRALYCSRSCSQRAYRERKKEKEKEGG